MYVTIGSLIISCTSQVGDAKEEVLVKTEGKELEIGFNPKYMLDALKVLDSENIILLINGDDKPIIINSVDDDTIIELILPIKTY